MAVNLNATIPRVIQISIFNYLDNIDLARSSSVCIAWNFIATHLQSPSIDIFETTNDEFFKKSFTHLIRSNDHLIRCVENFLGKIKLGQTARFRWFIRGKEGRLDMNYIQVSPGKILRDDYGNILSGAIDWVIEPGSNTFDVEEEYFSLQFPANNDITFCRRRRGFRRLPHVSLGTSSGDKCMYVNTPSYKARIDFPYSSKIKKSVSFLVALKLDDLDESQNSCKTRFILMIKKFGKVFFSSVIRAKSNA